jgi:hypothetical protein
MWTNKLYLSQLHTFELVGGVFPKAPHIKLPGKSPPLQIANEVWDLRAQGSKGDWELAIKAFADGKSHPPQIWTCYDKGQVAIVLAERAEDAVKWWVTTAEQHGRFGSTLSRKVGSVIKEHRPEVKREITPASCIGGWQQGAKGIPAMVAHINNLISQIMYPHTTDASTLVKDRVEYSLECICEHEQRQRRSTENDHTFDIGEEMDDDDVEYEPNPQKVVHTFTNALGLGNMYVDRRVIIRPPGIKDIRHGMQCWSGEPKGDSNQEWWYGAPSKKHRLTSFTALIPMSNDVQEIAHNVWKSFRDNHDYMTSGRSKAARRRKGEQITRRAEEATPFTNAQIVKKTQQVHGRLGARLDKTKRQGILLRAGTV